MFQWQIPLLLQYRPIINWSKFSSSRKQVKTPQSLLQSATEGHRGKFQLLLTIHISICKIHTHFRRYIRWLHLHYYLVLFNAHLVASTGQWIPTDGARCHWNGKIMMYFILVRIVVVLEYNPLEIKH